MQNACLIYKLTSFCIATYGARPTTEYLQRRPFVLCELYEENGFYLAAVTPYNYVGISDYVAMAALRLHLGGHALQT